TDAGKRIEVVQVGRHFAAEALLERTRHSHQALGLGAEESRLVDELLELIGVGVGEVGRRRVALEERRRDLVDGLVRGLRGEDRRYEELVRVLVLERAELLRRARVLLGQTLDALRRALLRPSRPGHRPNISRARK